MTIATTIVVGNSQITATLINQGIKGDQGDPGPAGPSGSASTVGTASASIGGHLVVRWTSAGQLALASNDQPSHRFAIAGVTTGAAVAGDDLNVQSGDVLQHNGWSWTPDAPVFLGTNGALTQTPPASPAFLAVIGVAVSSTRLAIGLQPPIALS